MIIFKYMFDGSGFFTIIFMYCGELAPIPISDQNAEAMPQKKKDDINARGKLLPNSSYVYTGSKATDRITNSNH